ncbi:MAG: hypothetical protein KAT78_02105 [Flavobacteriaceae bacterium]|nr:hypothetical protein [Flavobacteriaceae bacterium]
MKQEILIEKFIQNKLSSEENIVFQELLEKDDSFKKEVQLHVNLKKVIEKKDDSDFRNLISKIESKAKRPKQKNSITKWLIAASIISILGLSYFLTLEKSMSTQELFTNYFKPYRNVILPMQRNSSQQNEKEIAFVAYDHGEYEKAILLFSKLYTSTKEPYYLFYKANALLKLERANEAVPLLLEHLKTNDTLTEKSNWYLALAYLKLNDKVNAKFSLKKVIIEGKYKIKEAENLLKQFE